MNTLLKQLKNRRLNLGFKQNDMWLRVGISRQQYQRLESKGNPRLQTLTLIAKGLNSQMMLIPNEKLSAVLAVLDASEDRRADPLSGSNEASQPTKNEPILSDDPWQGLL